LRYAIICFLFREGFFSTGATAGVALLDSISTSTVALAPISVSASIFAAETGVAIVLQERLLCPSCLQIEHFILDVSLVLLVLGDSFLLDSIFFWSSSAGLKCSLV